MLSTYLLTQGTWNFPLLIVLSIIIGFYFLLIRIHNKINLLTFQKILFISGIILLYLMIGSPLQSLSYLSFSFHMIQMSIIYFIIPPLILLGTFNLPFYDRFLQRRKKFSIKPIHALIMFAILLLLYHVPFVLTFISGNEPLKRLYLISLFILAFIMWSPIAQKSVSKEKLRTYSKLSSYLIMPACLILIVSALLQTMDHPFLSEIALHLCLPANSLSILPPPFNTKYDQFMSGLLMISIHKIGLFATVKINNRLQVIK